jgi:uncharacterized protein YciI
MFIALLNYQAPELEVDYALADHAAWLRKQFDRGIFLAAGKCSTKADRAILTRPLPRGRLLAVLATDPLVVRRLAKYEVIEFSPTRTAHDLLPINEALAS